jgi:hypothetical protein
MRLVSVLTTILLPTLMISCEKSIDATFLEKDNDRLNKNASVSGLSYGSSLFYLGKNAKENLVSPTSKPGISGKFVSIPNGLSINAATGEINLSRSLTGLVYKVYYITSNGSLADSTKIVISGVDYQDGIYNLSSNQGKKAVPFYNANRASSVPNVSGNSFDATNTNGRRLVIDPKNGSIDLQATLLTGSLGGQRPSNGFNDEFSIQYRISDKSNRSTNNIKVKVYYFNTLSDVPESLLEVLATREKIQKRVDVMRFGLSGNTAPADSSETGLITEGSSSLIGGGSTEDPLEEDLTSYKVRPPLIILIGQ